MVHGARVWRLSAAEAEQQQVRAAAALRARGIGEGDRIALIVPSAPAVITVALGALRSGIVPVMLSPLLVEAERDALLDDAQPAAVFASLDVLEELIAGSGSRSSRRDSDLAPVPLARPMHYTSGTTGRPKGVWSGVLDEASARAAFVDERDVWGIGADDVLVVCSPLYHSAPLRFSASTLLAGGDVVLVERFDTASLADAIATHRPTVAFLVPSHLQRLFAAPHPLPDLSSFRLLAHAGEPCPPALKHRAFEVFPDGSVWEFYGSTEGQFTVCSPDEWLAHPGSVGRARRDRTISIDDADQIWCDVPDYARFTYWRDAEKTAAAWKGSAFTVGDLGRLDADGFLYIDGRRDDLIISGGVNVYPAEVEAALNGVDGVVEVAAFGAPDERWGQRVCLAVIGNASDERLRAVARERLAPYKRPKSIYRVDDLPRTTTGKIQRSALARVLGLDT